MPTTELPKQDLLAKLLGMTTSNNDGEALNAIRKANLLMKSAGWTWADLISKKIKIIENPFTGLGDPRQKMPPPPRPRGTGMATEWNDGKAQGSAQPQSNLKPPLSPISTKPNYYAGFCYCCGAQAAAHDGFIFIPFAFNSAARQTSSIICTTCNVPYQTIHDHPAKHKKNYKPSAAEL